MMNNKANIFEELNKMKSLIHAKSGVVISEQTNPIDTIHKEVSKGALVNSDEDLIVNTIINNYKTKETFQGFLNQYKQKYGKDFAASLGGTILPSNDKNEWLKLQNHLSQIGITLEWDPNVTAPRFDNKIFSCIKSHLTKKNIKFTVQPSGNLTYLTDDVTWLFKPNTVWSQMNPQTGKIEWTGRWECTGDSSYSIKSDGQQWLSSDELGWVDIAETSSDGGAKTEPTGSTLGNNVPGGAKPNTGQSVNNRFSKSVETLGIQGGKMDLQTLQTILKSLEGGESTAAAATTQGTPDLSQLTSLLNQL